MPDAVDAHQRHRFGATTEYKRIEQCVILPARQRRMLEVDDDQIDGDGVEGDGAKGGGTEGGVN